MLKDKTAAKNKIAMLKDTIAVQRPNSYVKRKKKAMLKDKIDT